jgi:hypothetical protein
VGINGRDGVQRWEIKEGIERGLIQRAIRSKGDTAACACTGITYERGSARADVDGVQKASTTTQVSLGACPVEHARARLEAKVADADRRPVVCDWTDRGDQGAGNWIDLDKPAGAATAGYG